MRRTLALLACSALAACAVGPNYRAPSLAAPPAYVEQREAPEASAQAADLSRWWAQFGDPELDNLIGRALAQNLDLKTAASRLREARAQVTVARAGLFPTLSGSAIAARRDAQGPGPNLFGGSGGQSGGASGGSGGATGGTGGTGAAGAGAAPSLPRHLELYSLGVDSSWQIDLFGGVRRGVEQAKAQEEAAVWQARDSQVALTAEVARAYFQLRLAQARKAVAQADAARLQDLLSLVAARFRAGVVTDLDVNQQRQQLTSRVAEIPQLDQQAQGAAHALSTLLNEPVAKLDAELSPARPLPAAPTALPIGLPSDLLRRRPDVRAAERQLAAATAGIGVAVADMYPKLDLLGLASFASTDVSDLLSRKNFSTIAAGDGSWSLFQGGRLKATVKARREEAEQADLAYRGALVNAVKEVEDALSAYAADRDREARLVQELKVSRDTAALAGDRYKAGLTPFTDVLNAQAAIYSAQDQSLSAQSSRLGDVVSLYTALGGGWSP